ncbi:DUF58 domain-containing protein [Cupriavidus sp. USMAHM13]|uniref:DUF58 domain-containing protein n=1 Tax=Cupriavidus sp. USMAHM13 TaxID=1389192 RepID=UPI0009F6B5DD|nr:DUF58 domain-containing protein [Cupriavidus sp. USMAHM13]
MARTRADAATAPRARPTGPALAALRRWTAMRLRRRRAPLDGVVTLDRRHLYILPTRSGAGFAVLLAAMLLTALNYNISLGFALTFVLGGIAMGSMWQAYRNLLDLAVGAVAAEPAFAGDAATFRVRLRNAGTMPRYSVALQAARGPVLADGGEFLAAEADAVLALRLDAPQRGWLALPRLTVSSRFPLALFRVWSHADLPLAALVYPAPETGAPPPPWTAPDTGDESAARSGDDGIDRLRRYRNGDPLHRIAWKHSARTGSWLTRTGGNEDRPACWLAWQDMPASLDEEARLSRLCAWVLAADESVRFGLRLPGVEIPPGSGAAQRRACLEALALWPDGRGAGGAAAAEAVP